MSLRCNNRSVLMLPADPGFLRVCKCQKPASLCPLRGSELCSLMTVFRR